MKLRIILPVLLAVVTGVAVWYGVRSAGQAQTIARLERELQAARGAPPPAASPVEQRAPSHPGTHTAPRPHPPARQLEVPPRDTSAPLRAQIGQLTTELTAAQAHGAELQLTIDSLRAENARLTAAENTARDQMAELRRSVETANSERAAIESKLHSIDAEVQTLRQQSRTATQRNEELTQTAKELQDVLRRQQTYVNNVVSRYREITDILRAPAAPAGSRDLGPDLVRAGSLISMTDEDLRAVRELNSRLALIQKRLLAAASRK
jgi:DNA repair exonuclease SbcCD ATPase subunit